MQLLKRRDLMRLAVGASTGLLLAACQPKAEPTATPAPKPAEPKAPAAEKASKPKGTMTLWGWDEPVCEMFNAAFIEEFPEVEIKYESADVHTKLLATLASGAGNVDVCWTDSNLYKKYAQTMQLTNMDEHMAAYKDGIPGFLWNMGMWEGHLYGATRRYAPNFFFYRKDIFEEAGVTSVPKTFDEYIEAGLKIQEKEPNRWLDIFRIDGSTSFFFESLMGLGSNRWYFASDEDKLTLDSPEHMEAVETYLKIIKSGVVVEGVYWSPEWLDGLATGEIVGLIGEYWFGQEPERFPDQSGKWGFEPVPAIKAGGTQATDSFTSNWLIIPKVSKSPDIAWEYIKFTCYNPESEAIQNTIDFEWVIPSYQPMNDHPLGQRDNPFFGKPVRSLASQWAADAVTLNCPPEFPDVQKIYMVELSAAAKGDKTAQEAVDKAMEEAQKVMALRR